MVPYCYYIIVRAPERYNCTAADHDNISLSFFSGPQARICFAFCAVHWYHIYMEFKITEQTIFSSKTYGYISMSSVIWKILSYISQDTRANYEIAVGTDSMTFGKKGTKFVVAIAIHKERKGGIYFYKSFSTKRVDDLHQKLGMETQLSLDTADFLIDALGKKLRDKQSCVHLVIHMDIGKNGATSSMIRELSGWVSALGYEYAIKPDSYASSTLADRISKSVNNRTNKRKEY